MFITHLLQVGFILLAIISGGIYFEEFNSFTAHQYVGFVAGVLLVCLGLYFLSPPKPPEVVGEGEAGGGGSSEVAGPRPRAATGGSEGGGGWGGGGSPRVTSRKNSEDVASAGGGGGAYTVEGLVVGAMKGVDHVV